VDPIQPIGPLDREVPPVQPVRRRDRERELEEEHERRRRERERERLARRPPEPGGETRIDVQA
jgi:hypothetical protein